MLKTAFNLILLRKVPAEQFNFPVNYSIILISILGILSGFDPSVAAAIPNPLIRMLISLAFIWVVFYFGVKFITWWLKRKDYLNNQVNLFNLLAASSLIDIVASILSIIDLSFAPILMLPLHIYSLIIAGNAIKGVANCKIGYAIIGLILWAVISIIIIIIIGGLFI